MPQLCENAISQLVHYHLKTLNQGPGAEQQRRRLRILIVSRRFSSALRNYRKLSLDVEYNGLEAVGFGIPEFWRQYQIVRSANFEPGNAERFTRIVCALLKLAFGNQRAERKTVKIKIAIERFNSISNPNKTQQLLQLLFAVRDTEVPVKLDISSWNEPNTRINIIWMAADVLGERLVKVTGSVDYASVLQRLPTKLVKLELGLYENLGNSTPMFSIVQIPSETIILTGNLGSLVADRCYKTNSTLKLLTYELSTKDLMEKLNFADEFRVLRSVGSQLEVAISATAYGDNESNRNRIRDFSLSTKRSLMVQLEQRLSRFRHIVDTANECGVTLRSLELYKVRNYNVGLARELMNFYDRQYGYTCERDDGLVFARFTTKYRRVEFDITDNFSEF